MIPKRLLVGAVASGLIMAGATGGWAQPSAPQAEPAALSPQAELDALFTELATPDLADHARIEAEIERLWSRSGSPAMDLLLRRGGEALEAEDHDAAIEHLSALTDHAPDFAEGWNSRATAFFYVGEYALAMADIERTLALEPRHYGALEGLALIFEELGRTDVALRAMREAQRINPNRPSLREGLARLGRGTGAAEL